MILNFLIAVWTICATAGAAPQFEYGSIKSTVTVYASCPDTTSFSILASNHMARFSSISADTTLHVAPMPTNPSLELSKSTGTIENSRFPKPTGKLETSELSDPAQTTILSQSFNNNYTFVVISGTTSWLNGQTPTVNPSQSFVVVTSSITVIPLSSPLPIPSTSNSEPVSLSTETVIPLSSHPSSSKTSSSESMVISTATSIPLPTLPQSSASQSAPSSELLSSNKPLVSSKKTIVPLIQTPIPTSSTIESSALLVPISSLTFSTWTSTLPSAANLTQIILNPTVKTSSGLNPSSVVSSYVTITESSSDIPSVSSPTTIEPESTWSIIEPVTSASSSTIPSTMRPTISSTVVPTSKPASILANSTSTNVPSATFSETITTTYLSALASSTGFIGSVIGISFTSTQSPSGRVFTGMGSVGGWNKTSSMIFKSSSFTIGTLTTLIAVPGFKDSNQPSAFSPSSTTSTLFPASLTTSVGPLTSTTSLSKVVSLSSMIPLYSATWTTKITSLSGHSTMSSQVPILNATSFSNFTSIPSSISISKTTSVYPSTTLITSASISTFIPTTARPSSIAFPNSTSVTSTSILNQTTPSSCGEQGDFVLNFDDLPPLSVSNASDTDVQPEPLFNPYHQFLFSDGFTVVPPPKRLPFLPSSSPLLLEFIPNFDANSSNKETGPNAADHGFSGQIGSGDEGFTGCFNFNLYGASLGCDSRDAACDFTFTGYSYDVASKNTSQVAQQLVNVPACPELSNCVLTSVELDSSFKDLTYFLMNVTVAGKPKIWWMDDLRLGWFDSSCTMGFCRYKTHLRR